jgi:signal transduction histidine kinase
MFLSAVMAEARRAQESLRRISGSLIQAHEEERSRIARELHDDLSQQMALLQISLEQFEQGETRPSSEAREKVHNLTEIASQVSSNIHDLSRRLHPSTLDFLGLLPSVAGFCREFSQIHHLQVQFAHHDIPKEVPKDVTLCLFRIVQEALRNVVKHSGVAQAKVELLGIGDRIELCVSDTGVGFDPASAHCGQGIGLVSMRERMRLIGGELTVESTSPHGTRICGRAPLPATHDTRKREAY